MNQLYQGDCVDIMEADMEAESVDLTVTSPPYDDLRDYNGYHFDFENIAKQLYRITKQGGVVVWIVADKTQNGNESGTSFRQALYFKEVGFNLFDTMIFSKSIRPIGGVNRYYNNFEYMFVFSKGNPKTTNLLHDRKNITNGKVRKSHLARKKNGNYSDKPITRQTGEMGKRGNVWHYNVGRDCYTKDKIAFQHPAIFPEKLAEDHILSWTNPNDLVFDPMCGSGTTGIMALLNNRKFIGVDISAEYIAIAKERLGLLYDRDYEIHRTEPTP